MIKRITVEGLGPHTSFTAELNPRGTTVVAGPSESGKTTLLEAVTFALWGKTSRQGRFPPEFIRDGHERAVVELVLDSGKTVRRSITRTKSQTRRISHYGNEASYSSEAKFTEALGDLGRDPVAVALVVTPLLWQDMVQANARPFRDVLARVLPAGDVPGEVRRLMDEQGYEVDEDDLKLDDKTIGALRRETRKARDEAAGRIKALAERIARIQESNDLGVLDTTEAQDVMARRGAWETYSKAARGAQARALALQNMASWDERKAELGDVPAYEEGSLEAAVKAEAAARTALKAAMGAYTDLDARLKVEQEQLKEMTLAGPDVCPTCERPGWEGGQEATNLQQAKVDGLNAQQGEAIAKGKSCRQSHNDTKVALDALQQLKARRDAYQGSLRALGARPELPVEAAGGPVAPEVDCPSAEQVLQAQELLGQARSAEGAAAQREEDLAEARADLEASELKHVELEVRDQRWTALLEAARQAPSQVARQQAEALGELGPVSLEFDDNPAVSVLIDGRPWWLASRGRQVVADVWLRTALRRAMGMDYLPLVVDNVQDVGGQPVPNLGGPMVILETTNATTISVVRKRT